MKRFLLLAALIASPVDAQVAPPASVTMLNGQPRAVTPTANYCSSGSDWVPCASVAGSGGSGGTTTATPTGTAGSPNASVVSVQGVSGGTPQPVAVTGTPAVTVSSGTVAISGTPAVTVSSGTVAISGTPNVAVTSSALPTGAATQATLAAVAAQFPASLGAKTGAASLSVVPASDGFSVVARGGTGLATGQVAVSTTAVLVVAARATRQKVTISVGAANACAFGNTGVTTTTGFPLQPVAGASVTLDTGAALYGVCSAATTVSFLEQF